MSFSTLGDFFLFKGLDSVELDTVEGNLSETVTYAKGQHLYDQHQFRHSLGLVIGGTVLVQTVSERDTPLVMNRLHGGDVFGVAALFDSSVDEYVTVLTALDTVCVRYITQEQMTHLFATFPRIAQNYIEFLSGRVRFLNRKIAVLTGGSSVNRLYQYCISRQQPDGTILLPDSMTELARILNMGRSSLYRSLDSLLSQNILIKSGKQYILHS